MLIHVNAYESQTQYAKWKKPDEKNAAYYRVHLHAILEKGRETENISVVDGC